MCVHLCIHIERVSSIKRIIIVVDDYGYRHCMYADHTLITNWSFFFFFPINLSNVSGDYFNEHEYIHIIY